ncbi:MAG: hypothetical protein O3C61_07305, partial [Proteobacteria bacterium]|nr:hypothetical protein [Pseudomonadota bacterium]
YMDIKIIYDGGWHFSNMKSAELIKHKLKSYLHHREFDQVSLSINEIEDLIKKKRAIYDLSVDKRVNKFRDDIFLEKVELEKRISFKEG